jgi:hypothetical protein
LAVAVAVKVMALTPFFQLSQAQVAAVVEVMQTVLVVAQAVVVDNHRLRVAQEHPIKVMQAVMVLRLVAVAVAVLALLALTQLLSLQVVTVGQVFQVQLLVRLLFVPVAVVAVVVVLALMVAVLAERF